MEIRAVWRDRSRHHRRWRTTSLARVNVSVLGSPYGLRRCHAGVFSQARIPVRNSHRGHSGFFDLPDRRKTPISDSSDGAPLARCARGDLTGRRRHHILFAPLLTGEFMLVRNFIFWLSTKRSVTNSIARRGMKHGFARRFVAGETLAEALAASRELCQQGRNVSLNHLGENVTTETAAREVCASYIEMIEEMHAKNLAGNISIKLTQLGLDLSKELCASLASSIAKRAADLHRTIEIDMEGSAYTDVTLDIFETVQRESGNAGLAVQAYLHRTERDLLRLAPLKPKIRLVKGAYREPAKIAVQGKPAVDANFKKLTTMLLEGAAQGTFLPAIASHDPMMVAHAKAEIARLKLAKNRYEFQMIYGIRRDLQQQVRDAGHTLQVYVPFGTDWCPYFMRRLSERPANCWFVLRSLLAESGQAPRPHAAS